MISERSICAPEQAISVSLVRLIIIIIVSISPTRDLWRVLSVQGRTIHHPGMEPGDGICRRKENDLVMACRGLKLARKMVLRPGFEPGSATFFHLVCREAAILDRTILPEHKS